MRFWPASLARIVITAALLVALPGVAHGQSEAVEYYALDAIGSVGVVFDANGTVIGRMDYDPFGAPLTSAAGLPSRAYAGLFRDGEAGLDFAQARSYQVRTGRFGSLDPIYAGLLEPQRWNRYAYGLGAPLSMKDPAGLLADSGISPALCGAEFSFSQCGGERAFWDVDGSQGGGGGAGFGFGGAYAEARNRGYDPAMPEAVWAGLNDFNSRASAALSPVRPSVSTLIEIRLDGTSENSQAAAVALGIALADSPVIGPADVAALIFLTLAVAQQVIFDADNSRNGPRSPGLPGIEDGFIAGKDGAPWVRNPNGPGAGWRAKDGAVWVPTGPGRRAHGGPHWDVEYPSGGHVNVYPGGRRRR